MKDINFLREYSSKSNKFNVRHILLLTSVIMLVMSLLKSFDNHNKIKHLTLEVDLLKANRKNEIVNMQLDTENDLEISKLEIDKQYDNLVKFDYFMDYNYISDEILLLKVVDSIPENLFLESIYLDQNIISLSGSCREKLLVAEFQNNLKSIISIDNVFIENIYQDNEQQKFNLNIYLRGISNDRIEE